MSMTWVFAAIFLLLGGYGIWVFNGLVKGRNLVEAAWADVDVQLQRRHDLVPRLVDVVKAYAKHEKDTLEDVIKQRDQALAVNDVAGKSAAESKLDSAIGKLVVLAESYPELKAGDNFLQLSTDLVETEDHLQYARRFYNGAVRDYNNAVERFPDHFVAGAMGFNIANFFQAEEGSRGAARVSLG